MRRIFIAAAAICVLAGPIEAQARTPDTWDGLMRVRAKKLDAVFLLPGADFRAYTKVMIDTPQIAFQKNWQRDQNSAGRGLSGRVSDEDVRRTIDEASGRFHEVLVKFYTQAGYEIASQPGPDVLQLSTAIINLSIAAPDTMSAGRSRTYSREAGEATLVLEARDSLTRSLLGRAVDERIVGSHASFRRNSATNRSDFEQLFTTWGGISAEGLDDLKALSPIDAEGALRK